MAVGAQFSGVLGFSGVIAPGGKATLETFGFWDKTGLLDGGMILKNSSSKHTFAFGKTKLWGTIFVKITGIARISK